jgi:hypothetical protein
MNTQISKNQISLAGEFAVLSQLALHGFDANLTLGNTKGVDILLSDPDTGKMRRLEVKTHSNNRVFQNKRLGKVVGKWRMGDKHEGMNDENLFFCFVSIEEVTDNFEFYIVPSKVVSDYVRWSHADWLAEDSKHKDTQMRSFDLGTSEHTYTHPVPLAEDYKRRWDLLK